MSTEEKVAQLEQTVSEIDKALYALQQAIAIWVAKQKESRIVGLSGDEDFLEIPYERSALRRRREKAGQG